MTTRVCLAGATGWVGKELSRALDRSDRFRLTCAVARSSAGRPLRDVVGGVGSGLPVCGTVREALATSCDVLVDYTTPAAVLGHVDEAIRCGVNVVVGTSGLTEEDFARIDGCAREREVGVLACGNFAITAILLQRLALLAATVVPHWEVIDYAAAGKPDAPSGTARELASKLAQVGEARYEVPVAHTVGAKESRGATVSGTQLHSVRLPGYTFSFEALFGLPGERLTLRHDAGESAMPYVLGTLRAIEEVQTFRGLRRGLESVA